MTDEEIFAQLAALEKQAQEQKKYYIFYNPASGAVVHMRNHIDEQPDEHPHIVVEEKELRELDPSPDINFNSLIVIQHSGKTVLSKKQEFADTSVTVDSLIYRIPKVRNQIPIDDLDYDILVEQNRKEKVFRFKLSEPLRQQFIDIAYEERTIGLYLTNERDPNILKRSFKINLHKIIKDEDYFIPFDGSEDEINDFFSFRYFPKYIHLLVE